MRDKKTEPFYSTAAWRRTRQLALDRDCGLCVPCRDAGRYAHDRHGRRVPVLATIVHHIQHLDEHPELALDLDNLVCVCDRCHDELHPEKHEKAGCVPRDPVPEVARGIGVVRL